MAKKVTTLFITDTGINLLVMKGKHVDTWASLPLGRGLVSLGLIADQEAVADKVRELFQQAHVKPKKVITAVSGLDSLYRIITLPDLPEAILPEAVKREAERTMPTSLDEVYFSYQALPGTGQKRFFLATFPRSLTDALMGTLGKAGIKPYVMDLAPLALCRIANQFRAIIVNARSEHFEVMVMTDRVPEVIRTFSLPTDTESLEDRLPFMAEEFARTVAFYNSGHLERPLDASVPVFVCGDLVGMPEAWPTLVGESGNAVSPLPSPVTAPAGFAPDEFMVNIGLALKEFAPDKDGAYSSVVNFNALPPAYVPEHFSIARVLIPVGIVLGAAALVFGGVLVMHNRAAIDTLRSDLTIAEGRVAQLQRDNSALRTQVGSLESASNTLNNTIAGLQQDRAEMHLDLQEIYRLAGETITLGSVNHLGSSVSLSGFGPNISAAYNYARALRTSGRFSSVWIGSITNEGTFSISLTK
jgi:type IV pilus assembly protein PilM